MKLLDKYKVEMGVGDAVTGFNALVICNIWYYMYQSTVCSGPMTDKVWQQIHQNEVFNIDLELEWRVDF